MSEFEFAYHSTHNHPCNKHISHRCDRQRNGFAFRFRGVSSRHGGFLWKRQPTQYEMAAAIIDSLNFKALSMLNLTQALRSG